MIKTYFKNQLLKFISVLFMTIFFITVWLCLIPKFKNKLKIKIEADDPVKLILPIIMYHGLTRNKSQENKFVISDKLFEEDLIFLSKNGFNSIFVDDLIKFIFEDIALPEKPIMLTFDDGYLNNYLYAFPILKKYNFKMILSPIGKCIDTYNEIKDRNPNHACITWDDAIDMTKSGLVEIQNHTYNMHSKIKRYGCKILKTENINKYKKNIEKDLDKFQKSLENHGINPACAFVYPFGAICKECEDIIKDLGYKVSFSCYGKINFIKNKSDLYLLGRILRPPGIPSYIFFKKEVLNKIESS